MSKNTLAKLFKRTAIIALAIALLVAGWYCLRSLNLYYFGRPPRRGDAIIILFFLPFHSIFKGEIFPLFMLIGAIGGTFLGILSFVFLYR